MEGGWTHIYDHKLRKKKNLLTWSTFVWKIFEKKNKTPPPETKTQRDGKKWNEQNPQTAGKLFSSGLAGDEWCLRPSKRPKLVERCRTHGQATTRTEEKEKKRVISHTLPVYSSALVRAVRKPDDDANLQLIQTLFCLFFFFFISSQSFSLPSIHPSIFHKPKSHHNPSDPPVLPNSREPK